MSRHDEMEKISEGGNEMKGKRQMGTEIKEKVNMQVCNMKKFDRRMKLIKLLVVQGHFVEGIIDSDPIKRILN